MGKVLQPLFNQVSFGYLIGLDAILMTYDQMTQ